MTWSRWVEKQYFPARNDIAMVRERLHYENLKSLTDKQLDVIRYLYMRLNIIDGKASYLLRINTLTASVISLLISFSTKGDGVSVLSYISTFQLQLLIFALIFIVLAFVLSFAIGELEYDRITEPPIFFNQLGIEDYVDTRHRETLPDPTCRRFLGKYSADEVDAIMTTVRSCRAQLAAREEGLHSLKEYEDLFFAITIARVKILQLARDCVALAVVFSLSFVLSAAVVPPNMKGAPSTTQAQTAPPAAPAPTNP